MDQVVQIELFDVKKPKVENLATQSLSKPAVVNKMANHLPHPSVVGEPKIFRKQSEQPTEYTILQVKCDKSEKYIQ
jgi:hypothetical protein